MLIIRKDIKVILKNKKACSHNGYERGQGSHTSGLAQLERHVSSLDADWHCVGHFPRHLLLLGLAQLLLVAVQRSLPAARALVEGLFGVDVPLGTHHVTFC